MDLKSKKFKSIEWTTRKNPETEKEASRPVAKVTPTTDISKDYLQSRRILTVGGELRKNPYVDFIRHTDIYPRDLAKCANFPASMVENAQIVNEPAMFQKMISRMSDWKELFLHLEFGSRHSHTTKRTAVLVIGGSSQSNQKIYIVDPMAKGMTTLIKSQLRTELETKMIFVKGGTQEITNLHADFQIFPKIVIDVEEIHKLKQNTDAVSFTEILDAWEVEKAIVRKSIVSEPEKKLHHAWDWEARPFLSNVKKMEYLANSIYYVMLVCNAMKRKLSAFDINDCGYEPMKKILTRDAEASVLVFNFSQDFNQYISLYPEMLGKVAGSALEVVHNLWDYTFYLSKHFDASPPEILSMSSIVNLALERKKITCTEDLQLYVPYFDKNKHIITTKLRRELFRVLHDGKSRLEHLERLECFRCGIKGHPIHFCQLPRQPGETGAYIKKNPKEGFRRQAKTDLHGFFKAVNNGHMHFTYRVSRRFDPNFRKPAHLWSEADKALNALRLKYNLTWKEVNEMGYFLDDITLEQLQNQNHKKRNLDSVPKDAEGSRRENKNHALNDKAATGKSRHGGLKRKYEDLEEKYENEDLDYGEWELDFDYEDGELEFDYEEQLDFECEDEKVEDQKDHHKQFWYTSDAKSGWRQKNPSRGSGSSSSYASAKSSTFWKRSQETGHIFGSSRYSRSSFKSNSRYTSSCEDFYSAADYQDEDPFGFNFTPD